MTTQTQVAAAKRSTTKPVEKSSLAQGLAQWSPTMDLPVTVTKESLSTLIQRATVQLLPATPIELTAQIDRIIEMAEAASIPMPRPKQTMKLYTETLAHLPPDLLSLAVDRIRSNYRWGNRMPLPADILGQVRSEYSMRFLTIPRAKVALLKVAPVKRPETRSVNRHVQTSIIAPITTRKRAEIRDPTPSELEETRRAWAAIAAAP